MSDFIKVPDYTGFKRSYSFNMGQVEGEIARKQYGKRVIRAVDRGDGTIRIDTRGMIAQWSIDIDHDFVRELLHNPACGYKCRLFINQYAPHLLERPEAEEKTETVEPE